MRRSRRTLTLLATAAAAALTLSACGAGGASTPDGAAPETPSESAPASGVGLPAQTVGSAPDCSLYTVEELEAVWGVSFVDFDEGTVVETSDGGVLYSCDYNETDSGTGLTFIIEYRDFATVEGAERDIANVRDGAGTTFVNNDVAGVGDEAFFSDPANPDNILGKNQRQLYARFGDVVLLVTALDLAGAAPDFGDKILESVALHF